MWRVLANSISARGWRAGAVLAALAAAAALWLWTARSGEPPAADLPAPVLWPPEQRVAPPPLDAGPENTWPSLRIAVVDEENAPVPGAVVQVWADGRGCVDTSFDLHFNRPDIVDVEGRVTWLSGAVETGPDGVAALRVPMGTATHLVASDATGRRAVLRVSRYEQCFMPCAYSDCGTCSSLPCTHSRADNNCAFPIENFVLRMAQPVRVTGVVRDQSGRPVAGARVIAAHLGDDDPPEPGRPWATTDPWPLDEWSRAARGAPHEEPALSDARGRFDMSLADDGGRIVLVALAADHAVGVSGIRLDRGPVSADLRVRRGSHIALRATGPDGRPIDGAIPSLGDYAFAPTGPDGRVVLHGVPADWWDVHLRADGLATRTLRVLTGGREANARLDWVPHARVEVVASKALLEELGDRAMVELSLVADGDRSGALDGGSREHRTRRVELGPDATGHTIIDHVPAGDYTVWVTWTGALIRGPRMQVAATGPSTARVELTADASLSGAVRDSSGGPLHKWDSACVKLAHGTAAVSTCALEQDGRYRFTMIPAGRWALWHGQERIGTIDLRPGANARDVAVAPVY